MKKTLVSFQFKNEYFTPEQNTTFVVKPSGVEIENDSLGFPKNTKDFPTMKPTRDMRGKGKIDNVVSQSLSIDKLSFLEFGVETMEYEGFYFLSMPINMKAQRWFLNIWTMDEDDNHVIFTSQNIEGILDRLAEYIDENEMMPCLLVDFIERLTTNENLRFISKVTAQPTNEKQKSIDEPYDTLQSIENTEELRDSLLGWLGQIHCEEVSEFIEKFHEIVDNQEEEDEAYKLVDSSLHPLCIEYFREMERILEWYNSNYQARTLTDESVKFIADGRFDEIAKQVVEKAKKKGKTYYVNSGKGNENKFVAESIEIGGDGSDFIEEQGFEVFKANLASSLKRLGYSITDIISFFNHYDFDMNVSCIFTAIIEKVNVKVEAK